MEGTLARSNRRSFTLECQSLDTRHELVLRSLLRVISARLTHAWRPVPSGGDVLVRSRGQGVEFEPVGVGLDAGAARRMVAFPFNHRLLESELNLVGRWLERATQDASDGLRREQYEHARFHLCRWPPVPLLRTSTRHKLAAVMLQRDDSATALARWVGCSTHECRVFLSELNRAGLLKVITREQADLEQAPVRLLSVAAPRQRWGLIGRIREHLGL